MFSIFKESDKPDTRAADGTTIATGSTSLKLAN